MDAPVRRAHRLPSSLLLAAALLVGCSSTTASSKGRGPEPSSGDGAGSLPLPADCEEPRGVFGVAEALADEGHPCHAWVRACAGRVLQSGNMSAALWTTQTAAGTGLFVSAIHTLGEGWIAPGGQAAPRLLRSPSETEGTMRLTPTTPSGQLKPVVAPMFLMFHPAVPAAETGNKLRDITPRHDFYVAAIDGQRVVTNDTHLGVLPQPLTATPPAVFDPKGHLAEPHADASPGDRVLMVGVPMQGPTAGRPTASVGLVLDEAGVSAAMAELRGDGDEEGNLAHDPEVEHIVRGSAIAGMSGGGVFDAQGRLVGVLVRASTETKPPGYVRFVRLTTIARALDEAVTAADERTRTAIAPYLPAWPVE
ncbi:MAG: trypsin-like peptidase domain-containing protein [Polyangiaceae bacterium]